jgi:hypothetical protein
MRLKQGIRADMFDFWEYSTTRKPITWAERRMTITFSRNFLQMVRFLFIFVMVRLLASSMTNLMNQGHPSKCLYNQQSVMTKTRAFYSFIQPTEPGGAGQLLLIRSSP